MRHITTWPGSALFQRRSGWPSALKSAVATGFHGAGTFDTPLKDVLEENAVPFISHAASWPVLGLCQRMSGLPSLLKSVQLGQAAAAAPTTTGAVAVWPSGLVTVSVWEPGVTPTVEMLS